MSRSSDRAARKVPVWVIVGVLAVVGYLLLRTVFLLFWDGMPRHVTAEQVTAITGIELPADARLVNSRYRAGLRARSLYAEFALPREQLPRFAKRTGERLGTVFSDSAVWAHWERSAIRAPGWWARRQDVVADAYAIRSLPDLTSRFVYVGIGRNPGSEAHIYLAWTGS